VMSPVDTQVMQGDIVCSVPPPGDASPRFGWVCCITPESNEGHVYWQSLPGVVATDSREPLEKLRCVDRALLPGDIVRYCDAVEGRDAMGMIVGTEVLLDLRNVEADDHGMRKAVPATSLRHFVPIRLVTWVVHRADGWLGRVQSWDEDLVLRFHSRNADGLTETSRCRIRGANQKQGVALVESFYRDFFPGLMASVNLQDLHSGALESEWIDGKLPCLQPAGRERADALIEEVSVGAARVEWLAQVPLWQGWSTDRPPRAEGCQDKLLFLLGEAESSLRWALGDRTRIDGELYEVCKVDTYVDVRWQDATISCRVPSRTLQLCNPDAFNFFPSELVCQRNLESAGSSAGDSRSDVSSRGMDSVSQDKTRRTEPNARVGYVVSADPASRMMTVRWLDEEGPSEDEEWSAFDLQIDPEFGYRLSDAVIRCRDWEDPAPREGAASGPQVGQVVALESGNVRVRWLDGTVTLQSPKELFRLGDEDDASVVDSQAETTTGEVAIEPALADTAAADMKEDRGLVAPDAEDGSTEEGNVPGRPDEEEEEEGRSTGGSSMSEVPHNSARGAGTSGDDDTAMDTSAGPFLTTDSSSQHGVTAMDVDEDEAEPVEMTLEDMVCEKVPSDHHFVQNTPGAGPTVRQFTRRVQREWEILRGGLPQGIWVHVYPDRMELLRACLVGPEGTPYVDSLFFFDIHLPSNYPQSPPQVKFWSFGENLNPNLYENGKVCLSLLGTWSGKDSETWNAEHSNLLQVVVSILGLVLNTEPYYNEPGFERERDTPQGQLRSQRYNESVALSCYHLMLRVLRTPPCDFEGVVREHFRSRRAAILSRAQRLHEDRSVCSEGFRKSLLALLPRLLEALPEASPAGGM